MAAHPSTFDYIIVGAGSAGAVVAARLTDDPKTSVLLIEAGPEDAGLFSKIPLWFAKIIADPRYMWTHESAPEPQLGDRRLAVPHGKVLGGSSTVNGLVWVRGLEIDYRTWEEMGARGWGYRDVLPYFKKSESWLGGSDEWHGRDGPIHVENARWQTPLGDAFIAAAMDALDLPRNDDFNGPNANGAGYWPLNTRRGRRSSTDEAYLKPNRERPNLYILTEAFVTRIEFEGREAVGVVYEQGGETRRARANREIVVSAGALQTPQLLQLSGIGPGELLARYGIAPVHELKGVGENLMDHVQVARIYETESEHTLNAQVRTYFGQFLGGVEYYVGPRRGPLTIGASLAGAYFRTRPELEFPDIHLHFLPYAPGVTGYDLAEKSGFRFGMYPCRPKSRGHVRIMSPDMREQPEIYFGHLSNEEDVRTVMAGLRVAGRIARATALQKVGVKEITPGARDEDDGDLLAYIRETAATSFHYSGTARMGEDEMAVVDPQLRVRGVGRLRVIDASVMPTIASGNTNPPVVMIAEKGSDLLRSG